MGKFSNFFKQQLPFMWGGENAIVHEINLSKIVFTISCCLVAIVLFSKYIFLPSSLDIQILQKKIFLLNFFGAWAIGVILIFVNFKKRPIKVVRKSIIPMEMAPIGGLIFLSLIIGAKFLDIIAHSETQVSISIILAVFYPLLPTIGAIYASRAAIINLLPNALDGD